VAPEEVCKGACLEVDTVPVRWACARCGAPFAPETPCLTCAQCGSDELKIISGEELVVDRIELANH
jgi:hydrogenase nickel incorporation protein HypA/HybF